MVIISDGGRELARLPWTKKKDAEHLLSCLLPSPFLWPPSPRTSRKSAAEENPLQGLMGRDGSVGTLVDMQTFLRCIRRLMT